MHCVVNYRIGAGSCRTPPKIFCLHSRINAAPWKYIFYTNPAGLRPSGAWVASAAAAAAAAAAAERARRGGPLLGGSCWERVGGGCWGPLTTHCLD